MIQEKEREKQRGKDEQRPGLSAQALQRQWHLRCSPKQKSNYSRYGLLLLLLLLRHFSRVRLCVTPWTAAHQASPSMGFSRQEYWSGLPFPSPMHESEVTQSCPTLSDPTDCSLPGSSVHGIFQARVLEWVAIAFSEVWSGQGIKTRCLLVKCTVPHAP